MRDIGPEMRQKRKEKRAERKKPPEGTIKAGPKNDSDHSIEDSSTKVAPKRPPAAIDYPTKPTSDDVDQFSSSSDDEEEEDRDNEKTEIPVASASAAIAPAASATQPKNQASSSTDTPGAIASAPAAATGSINLPSHPTSDAHLNQLVVQQLLDALQQPGQNRDMALQLLGVLANQQGSQATGTSTQTTHQTFQSIQQPPSPEPNNIDQAADILRNLLLLAEALKGNNRNENSNL